MSTAPVPDGILDGNGMADGGTASLNMNHLELFHHFLNEPVLPSVVRELAAGKPYAAIVDAGLANPYLMHVMLALASLHLSVARGSTTERCAFYRHQAAQLQVRAIETFNAEAVQSVTPANAVPLLLFSSLLGIHVLGDMLVYRDNHFSAFLDQFTAYLRLHRGVRAVTGQSWSYLCTSELRPLLRVMDGIPHGSDESRGSECAPLVALVEAADLSRPSIDACLDAVDHLQWVFDGVRGDGDGSASAIHAWPIVLSEDYARLLEQRRPEALVVLAYFGVAVHWRRSAWFLGDGGRFLVRGVSEYLGPFWREWLVWPNGVVDATCDSTMGEAG